MSSSQSLTTDVIRRVGTVDFLCCLFDNPFRPVTFSPFCLTETVVAKQVLHAPSTANKVAWGCTPASSASGER
jgi:hypothetical protein